MRFNWRLLWVNYDDVILALGAQDWSTRLPGNSSMIYPGVPEDYVTRIVATGGMVQCVPILQMTTIVDGSPRIGLPQQQVRDSVLAALIAGQAALP